MQVFQSVANLKATPTISADNCAKVLGYYSQGDGGGGDFHWDNLSTQPDNGGTIIQLTAGGTGRWKRLYDGPVDVRWFGAKCDGVTDDTVKVQSAIDYLASTLSKQVLTFTGKLKLNKIAVPVDYIRLDCNSAFLDFSSSKEAVAISVIRKNDIASGYSDYTGVYNNNVSFIDGGVLKGPGKDSTMIAIQGVGTASLQSVAHLKFRNLSINLFGIAYQYQSGCYNWDLFGCGVFECGTIFSVPPDLTNYGERLTLMGGTFATSKLIFDIYNANIEIFAHGASFDYCEKIAVSACPIYTYGCHDEHDIMPSNAIELIGTNGSYFKDGGNFQGKPVGYWFSLASNDNKVILNNVKMNGAVSTMKELVGGNADAPTVIIRGSQLYEIPSVSLQGIKCNILSDGNFAEPSFADNWYVSAGTITSKYSSNTSQLSISNARLKFDKLTVGNFAGFSLLVPFAYGEILSGKLEYMFSKNVANITGGLVSGFYVLVNGVDNNNIPIYSKTSPQIIGSHFIDTTSFTTLGIGANNDLQTIFKQLVCPSWANYFLLKIDLSVQNDAIFSMFIKNILFNKY